MRRRHPYVASGTINTPLIQAWEADIRRRHRDRADAFKHYVVAMGKAIHEITRALKPGGRALFVVVKVGGMAGRYDRPTVRGTRGRVHAPHRSSLVSSS